MELQLSGRVALITGSGRGIGAETAQAFAEEGCRIVVVDRNEADVLHTTRQLENAGHEAIGLACDVTNEEQVSAMAELVKARYGAVDILINNAGILKDGYLTRMSAEAWDNVMDVILKGTFLCSRIFVPNMMEKKWGRVINISSRSIFGNPGQTNYSAAKAGIIGFTRALSLEQARHGITVNAIAPGFIETPGIQSIPNYQKLREAAVAKNPVGFLGTPRDIANVALFLASDVARYITGTTVFATGGRFSS